MAQNKKFGAGLALIAGLIGMGSSGAALALPEVDVKTIPPIVAPNATDALDGTVPTPGTVDAEDAAS